MIIVSSNGRIQIVNLIKNTLTYSNGLTERLFLSPDLFKVGNMIGITGTINLIFYE